MRQPRSVSMVVPMYNEEKSVLHLLDLAEEALERHVDDYEIVLVDDASSDATFDIASARSVANARIRVVRHERNRGLGGALRTGFAAAQKPWILYTDCDVPWDLDETGRAFRAAEITGADFISGYRHDRTGEGTLRTIYSYFYNALIHLAFGVPIRDVNFSCKLVRRQLLTEVQLQSEGSFIDAEMIARLYRRGALIQQIGLDYFPRTRGVSTLSSPRVVVKILLELLRLAPDIRREKKNGGGS
ncbi:MAG: glycosyltransferase family 2 protein [Thermoanaerobaculia bacterium]